MAITNTLSTIKDYFIDWHTKNYKTLHPSVDEISNNPADDNKFVTNKAIKNELNASIKDVGSAEINVNGRNTTIQTTLNDFDSRISDIEADSVSKTDLAKFTEYVNLIESEGSLGFQPFINTAKSRNGLMTWKEKYEIRWLGVWKRFTGNQIGRYHTKGMNLYVNPVLRLVWFTFDYDGCPYLRQAYKAQSKFVEFNLWRDSNELINRVAPVGNVLAATNYPKIIMGMDRYGTFHIRATEYIKQNVDLHGTLLWYYGDQSPMRKII